MSDKNLGFEFLPYMLFTDQTPKSAISQEWVEVWKYIFCIWLTKQLADIGERRKENYWDTWFHIPKYMSEKILGYELLPKILSTEQIVEYSSNSNISRISRGMKMIFL